MPPQASMADELPTPQEIDVEFSDLYRHDEEQAYLTLMAQEIKSINFPCEENYTIRLCVRSCTSADGPVSYARPTCSPSPPTPAARRLVLRRKRS